MDEPFKKLNSEQAYQGKVINVRVDTVRYQERNFKWEIVEMGNAVVIMPFCSENKLLMISQYRYPVGTFLWEFPAGRAHESESLELCAQRELEEECGYRARHLQKLLTYYPSPGVITEVMHLYFARDLYEAREALPDEDEIINVAPLPIDSIEDMIKRGEIVDAKTILAFYHFKLYSKELL